MIAKIEDVKSALDTIGEQNNTYPSSVTDKMDAEAFNASCKKIENYLNGLYEKIRLIEDLDEFSRSYVLQKIGEKEAKLRERLKVAEDVATVYQKKDSVSVMVPFIDSSEVVRDRDGSVISHMQLKNKKLEADNDVMAEPEIISVTFASNSTCYNNSYSNLTKGKAGVSFYSLQEPPRDGVQENVTVYLASPAQCNYVSIHPTNCTVSNVRVMDANHKEYPIAPNGYFDAREIIAVLFTLVGQKYTREIKLGDANGYDSSGTFGMVDTAYSRWADEQIIKRMEISQAEFDRRQIVSKLETACDSWSLINKNIKNRNIVLAGDD